MPPPAPADAAPDSAKVAAYLELARTNFDAAAARSGGVVPRRLRLAGARIELRFAGETLIPLLWRALAHLEDDAAGAADLTVHLWDGASSPAPLPPPAWRANSYLRHEAVQGFHGGAVAAIFQGGAGLLSLVDFARNEAFVYALEAETIPYYETAAPLRAALGTWLARRGLQIVHAAAVGTPTGGALVVGAGGSGKSTTAAACLDSGLGFLADDYCLASAAPGARVFSLFGTAKLRPDGLDRLPHLRAWIANAGRLDREKPTLFVHEHAPASLLRECPLRALLVPEITGRPATEIRPCSRAEALRRLAPNSIAQQPGADPGMFRTIAALAVRVPAFRLALGTRLEEIAPSILRLLEEGTA